LWGWDFEGDGGGKAGLFLSVLSGWIIFLIWMCWLNFLPGFRDCKSVEVDELFLFGGDVHGYKSFFFWLAFPV
jgi:hypothetical protein